jgi:translocation and assembly module TamA
MRLKPLLVLLFLSITSSFAFGAVDLEIKGINRKVEANVDAYLSAIPKSDYSTRLRFRSRIEKIIIDSHQALGYYHPVIQFTVLKEDKDLLVEVDSGPATKIKEIDIVLSGEMKEDEDALALVANSKLKVGKRINHADYDELKSNIDSLALQKGYFDGKYEKKQLAVVPELNAAYIHLHYNSGERYHFGQTIIEGSQIWPEKITALQPYKEGDQYRVSQIGDYSQSLSSTNWFSSVLVEPDLTKLGESHVLPMTVRVEPAARNQLETGIGYSTDVGIKGSLQWNKPWISGRGHSFTSSFSISEPEQVITTSYKIPLEDVLHDYYIIKYGLKHVDSLDTQSIESNLAFERHWMLDNGWNRTLYVRYLIENYEQGILDDTGQFILPGMTFTRSRIRGQRLITWGDKESFTFEYGDPNALSETRVLRLLADTSWIRSYDENHRGIFRLDGGANLTDDFSQLSPSLRFFAGGDNSLRGYSYESISPTDSTGALTGAKYLATTSLEYQYRLTGNWWLAAFYDYGDAFNNTPDLKRGTGVGLRWVSPIGPLRLDFAWGLDADPGDEFQLHFTLGPEL